MLDIQEYLLLKGVEAVAIHGSKSLSAIAELARNIVRLTVRCVPSSGRTAICHQIVQGW